MSCYLDQIPWFMITCLVGIVSWGMGAAYTGSPSEDEMLRRLIAAEANRRIKARTEAELRHDIQEVADLNARRS